MKESIKDSIKDSLFEHIVDFLFSFIEGTIIGTIVPSIFIPVGVLLIIGGITFRIRKYLVERRLKKIKKVYINAEIIDIRDDYDAIHDHENYNLQQFAQKLKLPSILQKFFIFVTEFDTEDRATEYLILYASCEDGVTRTLKLDAESTDGSNVKRGKLRVGMKGTLRVRSDEKGNRMVMDFLPGFDADTGQVTS